MKHIKHIKLFEEMEIEETEFPRHSYDLSIREKGILNDLVDDYHLNRFNIKVDDHYYYSVYRANYNVFDNFNDLKDYVLSWYYIRNNKPEEYLNLLNTSNLDPSFDINASIIWACEYGHVEILKYLLKYTRIDPSVYNNHCIKMNLSGKIEILKLLLDDERVRSKLSDKEINKYTNEIS